MKKGTLRGITALGILLVLYHLAVFLIPFAKTAVFWLSYGFTLTAFAVGAGAVLMAFGRKADAKSRFYGFPVARVGIVYAAVQLIAGLVFMGIGKWVFWWIPALVYAMALGAALLGLIATEATLEEIQTQDAKLKKDVTAMRALQSKVCRLAGDCEVPALKKLAEELRYADPVSSHATEAAEADLADLVSQLELAAVQGGRDGVEALCRKATAALSERNRLCKLNK